MTTIVIGETQLGQLSPRDLLQATHKKEKKIMTSPKKRLEQIDKPPIVIEDEEGRRSMNGVTQHQEDVGGGYELGRGLCRVPATSSFSSLSSLVSTGTELSLFTPSSVGGGGGEGEEDGRSCSLQSFPVDGDEGVGVAASVQTSTSAASSASPLPPKTTTTEIESKLKKGFSKFGGLFSKKSKSNLSGSSSSLNSQSGIASTTGLILQNRPDGLPAKSPEEMQKHLAEYQRIMESVKRKERNKKRSHEEKTERRLEAEDRVRQALDVWRTQVITRWDQARWERKVRALWWEGVPSAVRAQVWRLAIGNELRLTAEMYHLNVEKMREKIKPCDPVRSCSQSAASISGTADSSLDSPPSSIDDKLVATAASPSNQVWFTGDTDVRTIRESESGAELPCSPSGSASRGTCDVVSGSLSKCSSLAKQSEGSQAESHLLDSHHNAAVAISSPSHEEHSISSDVISSSSNTSCSNELSPEASDKPDVDVNIACSSFDLVKNSLSESEVNKNQLSESIISKNIFSETGACKDGLSETGVSKNRLAESGATKDRSSESGDIKNHSSESGANKNQSSESDSSKNQSSVSGVTKDRSSEPGASINRLPKCDFTKSYSSESDASKDQSSESGSIKNQSAVSGVTKDHSSESGVSINRSPKSGATKNRSSECDFSKNQSLEFSSSKNQSSKSGTSKERSSKSGTREERSSEFSSCINDSSESGVRKERSLESCTSQNRSSAPDAIKECPSRSGAFSSDTSISSSVFTSSYFDSSRCSSSVLPPPFSADNCERLSDFSHLNGIVSAHGTPRMRHTSSSGYRYRGRDSSINKIKLDVSRTFPTLRLFQEGGPYHDTLHNLLGAYACYRPDIGYVQGMSYIAAVLLLTMEQDDAFVCFANILNKPCHHAFYSMDEGACDVYFGVFDLLFLENLPRLHAHLRQHRIELNMFLIDWIATLFSRTLPLESAFRVWDLFCRDGEEALFRAALGLLAFFQDRLLASSFDGMAEFLTNPIAAGEPDPLVARIQTVRMRVDRRDFDQLLHSEQWRRGATVTVGAGDNTATTMVI